MAWATLRKTVFGTIGGFLALHMLTVNTISTATAGFIFLFVRIINVFWDPMVGTYVDKRTSKAGKYRPGCYEPACRW